MTDATQNLTVNLQVNSPAANAAAQTLEKHQRQIEGIGAAYKSTASATLQSLAAIGNQYNVLGQQINTASKQSIEDFVAQNRAVDELGETLEKTSVKAEALRRTGGALSQLGLHEVGGLLSRAGDVIQVSQDLNKITEQFPSLGAAASAAVAQVGPLVATLLPVAAIAGAGALALKALTDAIAAQKKLVDDTVAALKSDTDARLANIDAIHNSTSEQIKAQIETDQAKLKEIQAEKAYRQQFLEDVQKQYADLGSSFDPVNRAALGEAGLAAQAAIDDLTAREQALTQAIKANTQEVLPAIEKREAEAKAIEDSAKAAENAEKGEQKLADARTKASDQLTAVTQKLAEEGKRYQQILDERATADSQAAQIAALQDQINHAREQEQEQANQDRLTAIRQKGIDAETAAQSKLAQSIDKVNQSAMEAQLKLLQGYLKAEQRATEDYSRERVRKLEDLYNSLNELAAQRDVAGFVNARRAGLTDVARGDEDAGVAARRRREDYEQQAREAEANRQRQLADLQNAYAAERQVRQQQLAEQLQKEQEAGQQRLSQSAILEKQLTELQAKFAKDNLATQRRLQDEAHQQTISRLQAQAQQYAHAVTQLTAPVVGFFGSVGSAIVNMIQQVQIAGAGASNRAAVSSGGGGGQLKAYAAGIDSVPRDMLAMVHQGERITRAVDNRRTTNAPVIQLSIGSVGENVSRREIESLKDEIVESVLSGFERAVGKV